MIVVKVPFNAGSLKDRETIDTAPGLIQEAVKQLYVTEGGNLPVLDFQEVKVDNANLDASHAAIEKAVSSLEHFSVLLGGDHSITLSAFKGFAKGKANPGLIVFDAHPDLMESFGTHEDYLRTLIEEGHLKASNLILVGIRNADKAEIAYIKQKGLRTFPMKQLESGDIHDICDVLMESARGWSDLYVSFDIDVLDPAFAPGVSYPEPGGLSTRELLYFVHRLKLLKNFKMADIVEVNPGKDNGLTMKTAAKLLVELN